MDSMQPGQVIIPHSADEPQPPTLPSPGAPVPERPEQEPGESPHPAPTPAPAPEPAAPPTQAAQPGFAYVASAQQEQDVPVYVPYDAEVADSAHDQFPDDISWTASEYVEHQKGAKWYGLLGVAGLVIAVLNYVITKDVFSTGAIMIAAVVFGVFAGHKPRTQQYALTSHGLQIGNKTYFYEDFKNFSVATEGAIAGIIFMPLKRFMPPLTIYVSPDMEDQIVDFLSQVLPFEQHRTDAVDSLLRKIRF